MSLRFGCQNLPKITVYNRCMVYKNICCEKMVMNVFKELSQLTYTLCCVRGLDLCKDVHTAGVCQTMHIQ